MPAVRAIDIHIHLAGAGAPLDPSASGAPRAHDPSGADCYFHPRRLKALGFRLLARSLGAPARELKADLTTVLREILLGLLREESSLEKGVVLAMDWARDGKGEPLPDLTDFHVPNDYVLGLARACPKVLAGVSIHPFRPDAVEELNRCALAGAALVKWLPTAQNFSPADARALPFLREMARLGMPLLSHTGSEGATRNFNKAWNDPRLLRPALEAGVTVVAAHCGLRSFFLDRDWLKEWAAMLPDYPHLYGDTASLFGLRARRFLKVLDRRDVIDRLVHGSDWPVPASPWWFMGAIPLARIRELARIENPLERDLETKRALGLPDAVFTRARGILRWPGRTLGH
ncbi:MAG: amidohydrolase family protein [Planctomycetota bacterium]